MYGWHISVYRQADGGSSPAKANSERGARLAVWQADLGGLKWLDTLVGAGLAIDLGGNGYPMCYTASAEHVIPRIVGGPPEARDPWLLGVHDVILPGYEGRTVIDHGAVDACRLDEWLLVEAWDES